MPIVEGTAPSGEKFDFYVPKGTTREQGPRLAKRAYYRRRRGIDVTQPPPLPQSTMGGEFMRGAESLASALRTAGGAAFGDDEAAALAALERSEDIAQKYGAGPSFQAVRDAEGILPTVGTALGQIPRAVAGQVPQLGLTAAGAAAGAATGAALGSVVPGIGTVVGGGLGALASLIPQFTGYNIERQAEADIAEGRPVDIEFGKAAGTAALQAVPELVGQYFIVGRGVVGKIIGEKIEDATHATATRQAKKLLNTANEKLFPTLKKGERAVGAIGRGIARGAAAEMPTEVAQQVLERAQAGLDILSDEAMAEYGEAAYLAATVGGTLGPIGTVGERRRARRIRDDLAKRTEEAPAETAKEADPLALPAPVTRVTPEGQAIPTEGIAPFEQERAAQEAISAVGAGTSPEIIQARQQAEERRAAAELEPQRELFPELVEVDAKLEAARAGTPTTLEDVDIVQGLGVPKASPVLKRIRGKDLSDPTQRAEVQEELTKYSKNGAVKPATRAKVKSFLASPTFVEAEVQAPQQLTLEDAADTREIKELYAQDEQKELFAEQEAADRALEAAKTTVDATELEMNIGEADRRVAQTQQEKTAQNRNAVLQPILERDDITSMDRLTRAFSAELGRQGFTNTEPTQDELVAITRRSYELDEEGTRAEVEEEQGAAGVAELQDLIPEKGAKKVAKKKPAKRKAKKKAAQPAAPAEPATTSLKAAEEVKKQPRDRQAEKAADFLTKKQQNIKTRAQNVADTIEERNATPESLTEQNANAELDAEKFREIFDEIKDVSAERDSFLATIAADFLTGTEAQQKAAQAKIEEIDKNFSEDVKKDLQAALNTIRMELGYELPVHALSISAMALEPRVVELLREGNLVEALDILSQSKNKEIKRVARVVSKAIAEGNTKVTLESNLQSPDGRVLAGAFDPKTNTILLNQDLTLTPHVLLHESLHAVTSHEIANKSSAITKQLQTLFDDVKDRLDSAYGATNLDEFVAEAFSNPEFQAKLAAMDTKGDKLGTWERFLNIVKNVVRRIRRLPVTPVTSARSQVDKLVMDLVSPAPEYRNAAKLNMAVTANEEAKVFGEAFDKFTGPVTPDMIRYFNNTYPTLSSNVRKGLMSALPLNSIADFIKDSPNEVLQELGKELDELFKVIQEKNGSRQRYLLKVKDTTRALEKVFDKLPPEQRELFNKVVQFSTLDRVDPSLEKEYYEGWRYSYVNQNGQEFRSKPYTTKEKREEAIANDKDYAKAEKDHPTGKIRLARSDPSGGKLEAYDKLKEDYNKLDKSAQKAYVKLRDAYAEAYTDLRTTIIKRIDEIQGDESTQIAKQAFKDKILLDLLNKESIEPYFPLYRKGDFWYTHQAFHPYTGEIETLKVAFESREKRNEYAKFVQNDPELRQQILDSEITTVIEVREKARAEALANNATPQQAEDVAVAAVIEGAEAKRPTNKLEKKEYSQVDIRWAQGLLADVVRRKEDAANLKKKEALADGKSQEEAEQIATNVRNAGSAVQQMVLEAMLDAMPERGLERAFKARKGTLGAEEDAIKVFGERMPAFMGQIDNLRFDNPLTTRGNNLKTISNKAAGTPDADYANEVYEKGEQYISFVKNPEIATYARALKSAGFLWTLGFNLSSAVVNSFILPIVVLPFLGGKYGYGPAFKAMMKAGKLYLGTGMRRRLQPFEGFNADALNSAEEARQKALAEGKSQEEADTIAKNMLTVFDGPSLANLDPESLPEEYRELKPLIEELVSRGAANASTIGDMLDLENPTGTDFERAQSRVNAISGFLFHQGERFNRQVTAMAAYELAMEQQKNTNEGSPVTEEQQKKIIADVLLDVEHTNSGALIETAPTIAQGNIASVLLMYKRFGVSMAYLQMKMAKQAFNIGEYDPDQTKDAKKQLAGLFGMSGLLAGAQGLPLYGIIAGVWNLLLSDDEDDDFDSLVASYIGEGPYSGALNELFGLDVAPRIGMTNLLFRTLPNKEYESTLAYLMELGGGPLFGIANRMDRSLNLMMDGEYRRGVEGFLPAGFSSPLKSIRYATEGATTLRGDPIVEDMSAASLMGQFFGFAPAGYTKQLELNARDKRIDRNINEKRTRLLRQRYVAYRTGDFEGVRDVDKDINKFNQRNPEVRITGETKARSLRQHKVTSEIARQLGGITISRRRIESVLRKRLEETGESDFFI